MATSTVAGGAVSTLRNRLGALKRYLAAERKSQVQMSLQRKLTLWRYGFQSACAAAYDLDHYDATEFLSDYAKFKAIAVNEPYAALIAGKLVFEAFIGRYLPVPRNLALIAGGRVLPLGHGEGSDAADLLTHFAEQHRGVVLKPVSGAHGAGVMVLNAAGKCTHLNGREVSAQELNTLVGTLDHYLVSEFVHQASYSHNLFPGSANTVRVITMVDPLLQEPFIPIAVHRIGTRRSAPVDNWDAGGLSARIDLETGALGPAAWCSQSGTVTWHETHPDTGAQIAGVAVRQWQLVTESLLRTVRRMPYLRYIAWDVVVTDDGFMVLEANNTPGLPSVQVHGPLLRYPRVRQFYRYYRVI